MTKWQVGRWIESWDPLSVYRTEPMLVCAWTPDENTVQMECSGTAHIWFLIYIEVLIFKMTFRHSLMVTLPACWTMRCQLNFLDSPLPCLPCFQPGAAHCPGAVQMWKCLISGGGNRGCHFSAQMVFVKFKLPQWRQICNPLLPFWLALRVKRLPSCALYDERSYRFQPCPEFRLGKK